MSSKQYETNLKEYFFLTNHQLLPFSTAHIMNIDQKYIVTNFVHSNCKIAMSQIAV